MAESLHTNARAEDRLFARYGLEVGRRWLDLPDPAMRVRVLESGTGDHVLLVHGGGGSAAVWVPLMAELAGFHLFAVDRPGCGETDGFDYRGVDVRRHAVAFLESVMDGLGLASATVVANSMGGLWALWLALERPGRVRALAQLGCPAFMLGTAAPLPMRLLATRGVRTHDAHRVEESSRQVVERLAGPAATDRLPPEMLEVIHRAESAPNHQVMRQSLLAETLRPWGPRPDLIVGEHDLRMIHQPTAFVWGDRDGYGDPTVGESAVGMMPEATLEVLPAGHLPWLDHPVPCARAVRRVSAAARAG